MEQVNNEALKLGRIQTEFNCLYGTKEMRRRLTIKDRTQELLRICKRENVSYKSFVYLEKHLTLNPPITGFRPHRRNYENISAGS